VVFEEEKRGRQKILLAVATVLLVAAAGFGWYQFGGKSAARLSAERVFKCTECGHDFEHTLQIGDMEPLECPKCDQRAGWKAEACYWTKDAEGNWKAKLTPTFVVVQKRVDPSATDKTYCPDCGHEVVPHNPRPPKELMDAAGKNAAD
jgi:DNA-directed RNA polymerase subunit RPC12/RpoP